MADRTNYLTGPRRRILYELLLHGPSEDRGGMASTMLQERVGGFAAGSWRQQILSMAHEGLIIRDVQGKRTRSIAVNVEDPIVQKARAELEHDGKLLPLGVEPEPEPFSPEEIEARSTPELPPDPEVPDVNAAELADALLERVLDYAQRHDIKGYQEQVSLLEQRLKRQVEYDSSLRRKLAAAQEENVRLREQYSHLAANRRELTEAQRKVLARATAPVAEASSNGSRHASSRA